MKNIAIGSLLIILLARFGFGLYSLFFSKSAPTMGISSGDQAGHLPVPSVGSSTLFNLPDFIGQASQIYPGAPTGTYLSIGTARGTVQVKNFYISNPPVVD